MTEPVPVKMKSQEAIEFIQELVAKQFEVEGQSPKLDALELVLSIARDSRLWKEKYLKACEELHWVKQRLLEVEDIKAQILDVQRQCNSLRLSILSHSVDQEMNEASV